MFMGVPVLGDTGLQTHQHQQQQSGQHSQTEVAPNHVFDQVSVSWGISDGHKIHLGF